MARSRAPVPQSVTQTLQSPAPPLTISEDRLDVSGMKTMSRTVPSWHVSSTSSPESPASAATSHKLATSHNSITSNVSQLSADAGLLVTDCMLFLTPNHVKTLKANLSPGETGLMTAPLIFFLQLFQTRAWCRDRPKLLKFLNIMLPCLPRTSPSNSLYLHHFSNCCF